MIPGKLSNAAGGGGLKTGLRYPSGGIDSTTDYVSIAFHEYKPPFSKQAFGGSGTVGGYNKSISDLGSPIGSALLYMPQDVSVQYGASWQDMNFSNIARSAVGATGQGFGGDLTGAAGTMIEQFKETLMNGMTKGTAVAAITSEMLQQTNFGNFSVQDIFSGTKGEIFNPNTEVLYQGPKMRGFSLEFKMMPESDSEAQVIKDILILFKTAILPKYGNAGANGIASFVKVPSIANVTFMTGNTPNPNVTQFKPCAMIDLDISYTPDGSWATYRDGTPVATTLKATFQELKMVYAEEVAQGF